MTTGDTYHKGLIPASGLNAACKPVFESAPLFIGWSYIPCSLVRTRRHCVGEPNGARFMTANTSSCQLVFNLAITGSMV